MYQHFEEFIKLLNENKVEYLVIGGYAVTLYSRAKYTKDIDIWINNSFRNVKKVRKVVDDFMLGSFNTTVEDLMVEDNIIQLGYEPGRIDIICGLEGIKFKEAFKKKYIKETNNGIPVSYISLEDLIKSKKIAGRPHDLYDLEWINKYRMGKRKKK